MHDSKLTWCHPCSLSRSIQVIITLVAWRSNAHSSVHDCSAKASALSDSSKNSLVRLRGAHVWTRVRRRELRVSHQTVGIRCPSVNPFLVYVSSDNQDHCVECRWRSRPLWKRSDVPLVLVSCYFSRYIRVPDLLAYVTQSFVGFMKLSRYFHELFQPQTFLRVVPFERSDLRFMRYAGLKRIPNRCTRNATFENIDRKHYFNTKPVKALGVESTDVDWRNGWQSALRNTRSTPRRLPSVWNSWHAALLRLSWPDGKENIASTNR